MLMMGADLANLVNEAALPGSIITTKVMKLVFFPTENLNGYSIHDACAELQKPQIRIIRFQNSKSGFWNEKPLLMTRIGSCASCIRKSQTKGGIRYES